MQIDWSREPCLLTVNYNHYCYVLAVSLARLCLILKSPPRVIYYKYKFGEQYSGNSGVHSHGMQC